METQTTREKFWPRQFSPTITTGQIVFDIIVGAIIPIVLLYVDPTVFRTTGVGNGNPVLSNYAIFAYLAIGLGILTLTGWLFVGELRQTGAAFIAGVLLTGALFAMTVGVVLAPFSVLGLFMCIGALGFFPFLTAFVYLRNGIRAFRAASAVSTNYTPLFASLLVGAILVLGLPALAQAQISKVIQSSVNKIVENPTAPDPSAINTLKQVNTLCLHVCTSTIGAAFDRAAPTCTEQQKFGPIYQQITGQTFYSSSCNSSD